MHSRLFQAFASLLALSLFKSLLFATLTLQSLVHAGEAPTSATTHAPSEDDARRADHDSGQPPLEIVPPTCEPNSAPLPYDADVARSLTTAARERGSATRGAVEFSAATSACLSCHKVGPTGGALGPDLSQIGAQQSLEQIVESVLWPQRIVKPEYVATAVETDDGREVRGYKTHARPGEFSLRDGATGAELRLDAQIVVNERSLGSLMPDGLVAGMNDQQRADLFAFLGDLGRGASLEPAARDALLAHSHGHAPAEVPFERAPLDPGAWPLHRHPVNRDRIYDFYAKQARRYRGTAHRPARVSEYPGLDGGTLGHWGNQSETTWADGRWNATQLGSVQCGVLHGDDAVVARGVCVRLGERGEWSACFDPDALSYPLVWKGGFVAFSSVRHGFLDGLQQAGATVERRVAKPPNEAFRYHGFYRHGSRVIFAYRLGRQEMLDAPQIVDGKFASVVGPRETHPDRRLIEGGDPQWPQTIETRVERGEERPFALDTIELPTNNPWNALLFCGDHDFLPDGSILVCTMQGDVWRASGVDAASQRVAWRRVAAGLHHPLGLVVQGGDVFVLGRDQLTRLHDLNGDGEFDFYECFCNAWKTSAAGHDFISGLARDEQGRFYTASGNQGILRIAADGSRVDELAHGLRNPDGCAAMADGTITAPCSEGDWTPASMICAVRPGQTLNRLTPVGGSTRAPSAPHFGHGGPRDGAPPDLPLVYLPRGLDNSSGGQAEIPHDAWGPLGGQWIHTSYGTGAHFLLLRDEVEGFLQGGVVPLRGEFRSGVHRAKFHPIEKQLYVSGMAGWGTYTPDDGCLHRMRYTGDPVQGPVGFHVYENGIRVDFAGPIDAQRGANPSLQFAQAWNYRYGGSYGSPEFSPSHDGVRGHDVWEVAAVHALPNGRSVFLELPELRPVNQLHLQLQVDERQEHDLFLTVHKLDRPFTQFIGYAPREKQIAAHPMLVDLARTAAVRENPHATQLPDSRPVAIQTGKNLTFVQRELQARVGETLRLTLDNPDVVPHNWALVKPGRLHAVGALANRLIGDPEAALRQYIPASGDVICYTNVVEPGAEGTIYFRVPDTPGRYPYLCTFPGHWMVMNGELVVGP